MQWLESSNARIVKFLAVMLCEIIWQMADINSFCYCCLICFFLFFISPFVERKQQPYVTLFE